MLGIVVTDRIYRDYPNLSEGQLAKLRASVVSAPTLSEVARGLDLGLELRLGKGEELSGGRSKSSILSDAMEAVIGAVYIDAGPDCAAAVVLALFGDHIAHAAERPGTGDFKTRLQELAAREHAHMPIYQITEDGPDHAKRFHATVALEGVERGVGEGRSKKEAEQAAAKAAWMSLRAEERIAEGPA